MWLHIRCLPQTCSLSWAYWAEWPNNCLHNIVSQQDIWCLLPKSLNGQTIVYTIGYLVPLAKLLDQHFPHWAVIVCWHTSLPWICYRVAPRVQRIITFHRLNWISWVWWVRIQVWWAVFVHCLVLLCSRLPGRGCYARKRPPSCPEDPILPAFRLCCHVLLMSPLFPAEAFSEVITTNTPEWVMATTVGEESLEYWYFKPILWHGPQQLLWFKQEGNDSRRCIFKLQIWLWDTTQEHEYHPHHEGLVIQKQFSNLIQILYFVWDTRKHWCGLNLVSFIPFRSTHSS